MNRRYLITIAASTFACYWDLTPVYAAGQEAEPPIEDEPAVVEDVVTEEPASGDLDRSGFSSPVALTVTLFADGDWHAVAEPDIDLGGALDAGGPVEIVAAALDVLG